MALKPPKINWLTLPRRTLPSVNIAVFWLIFPALCPMNAAAGDTDNLAELSIEELMNRKVVTPSRTEQNMLDTAAAVFVISQNDIRRSGATSIPEALRLVPGLHVARIDSSKWAISARGFNGRFANNLLVLMDGRTLYTPEFSGVYWEIQDRVLEDIERIEVIRGPGASVWGANAVNGTINIITKNSSDTNEGILSVVGGDKSGAGIRQGWQFADQGHARAYAKFFRQDGFVDRKGNDAKDDWSLSRGGFRLDWALPESKHSFMAQGDMYYGNIDQNYRVPAVSSPSGGIPVLDTAITKGGNVLARWDYTQSLASRFSVQFFYEHFQREERLQNERSETFDFNFQHNIAFRRENEFSWGLEYRFSSNNFKDAEFVSISPNTVNLNRISAFFQDKWSFFNQRAELTFGSKFEHHTYDDFEYEPSIRLLWKASNHQRFWAAISRSVRFPAIGERNGETRFTAVPRLKSLLVLQGNQEFKSETVLSYELGYRFWSSDRFFVDLAAFYNDYDNLIFAEPAQPTEIGKLPLKIVNGEKAKTWGLELTADWRPYDWVRLQFSSSYLNMNFKRIKDSVLSSFPAGNQRDPQFQTSFRSSFDLSPTVEFDFWLRYVDEIPNITVINAAQLPSINSYVAMDARLAWKPYKDMELAFVVNNINDSQHLEYLSELGTFPIQIERQFFMQGKWKY